MFTVTKVYQQIHKVANDNNYTIDFTACITQASILHWPWSGKICKEGNMISVKTPIIETN